MELDAHSPGNVTGFRNIDERQSEATFVDVWSAADVPVCSRRHCFSLTSMELADWQLQRVESSIAFILEQRMKLQPEGAPPVEYDVVELQVPDDLPNKSTVIKASNAILNESARSSRFIVVLYINQYSRDNLLHELFDVLPSRDYSRVFFIDELIANPLGNKMVPKHELCSNKMVKKLLREHSITINALPKILLRDPVVRWYGWRTGDVIRITRHNGELYYRMVVDAA